VFFDHAHGHQGHSALWLLLLVLFVVLAAVAIYALIRLTRGGGALPVTAAAGPDAAVESVRMRYARGEIDREEFVRVSTDLGAPPPAAAI
jgi:putative membrane protein